MAKRWTWTGSDRHDDYEGGWSVDRIHGRGGDDELSGEEGNDLLVGGAGRDELSGDEGDDVLRGGRGDDDLSGDEGNDRLFGGAGRDRFDFSDDRFGRDVVGDFQAGRDALVFDDDHYRSFAEIMGDARQKGDHVVIATRDGVVKLRDTQLSELSEGDFLFS